MSTDLEQDLSTDLEQDHLFNIFLLGDDGVGKTAFIRRHMYGTFFGDYTKTEKGSEYLKVYNSFDGNICFNVLDKSDDPLDRSKRIDAVILLFDLQKQETFDQLSYWFEYIKNEFGDIPVVVLGNKCDLKDRAVPPESITFCQGRNLVYFDYSVKSN